MRPETMARPGKTVRPEQKTKVRPEAKAPDRQINKVFSSSDSPVRFYVSVRNRHRERASVRNGHREDEHAEDQKAERSPVPGMRPREQQHGASRRRQRALTGLRPREAAVLKPEKSECPKTAGREKQRPWVTNESERPQAKRNRKPGAKNETRAKTKTPYRQGQGEPEGKIKTNHRRKACEK
jgi:hypothetical protein